MSRWPLRRLSAAFAGFPVRGPSAVHDVVVSSASGTDAIAEASAAVSQHRALHVAVTQDLAVINERAREVGLTIGWTLPVGASPGLQSAVSWTRSLARASLFSSYCVMIASGAPPAETAK
jgi:hypothetical protein